MNVKANEELDKRQNAFTNTALDRNKATARSIALLDTLTVSQLVKQFLALHGT
jgi:hypothetical protein